MPFTPSHAVVALPFVRTPLVPGAIAIGAMTPDLPLFVRRFVPDYAFTHSTVNIAWTTLIAAALLLLWRLVLRPAAVELAPGSVAGRLPAEWRRRGMAAVRETFAPGERFGALLVVLSLMLGVLSHIAWDGFTHEGRWGVDLLPVLDERWGPLPGYKWLQYASGVGGLLVIGVFALLWLRRRPVATAVRRTPGWVRIVWWLSLPATLFVAGLLGIALLGPFGADFTLPHLIYRVLVPATAFWGVATLLLCLLLPFWARSSD